MSAELRSLEQLAGEASRAGALDLMALDSVGPKVWDIVGTLLLGMRDLQGDRDDSDAVLVEDGKGYDGTPVTLPVTQARATLLPNGALHFTGLLAATVPSGGARAQVDGWLFDLPGRPAGSPERHLVLALPTAIAEPCALLARYGSGGALPTHPLVGAGALFAEARFATERLVLSSLDFGASAYASVGMPAGDDFDRPGAGLQFGVKVAPASAFTEPFRWLGVTEGVELQAGLRSTEWGSTLRLEAVFPAAPELRLEGLSLHLRLDRLLLETSLASPGKEGHLVQLRGRVTLGARDVAVWAEFDPARQTLHLGTAQPVPIGLGDLVHRLGLDVKPENYLPFDVSECGQFTLQSLAMALDLGPFRLRHVAFEVHADKAVNLIDGVLAVTPSLSMSVQPASGQGPAVQALLRGRWVLGRGRGHLETRFDLAARKLRAALPLGESLDIDVLGQVLPGVRLPAGSFELVDLDLEADWDAGSFRAEIEIASAWELAIAGATLRVVALSLHAAYAQRRVTACLLFGRMALAGFEFEAMAEYESGGWTLRARSLPGARLSLTAVLRRLVQSLGDIGLDLGAVPPDCVDVAVSELFLERAPDGEATFYCGLAEPVTITSAFTIDHVFVRLQARSSGLAGYGQARIVVAGVDVLLEAGNTGGVWRFKGGSGPDQPIPVGRLLADLAAKFGVAEALPATLDGVTFRDLQVSYAAGGADFSFAATCDLELARRPLELTLEVLLARGAGGDYAPTLQGLLKIGEAQVQLMARRPAVGAGWTFAGATLPGRDCDLAGLLPTWVREALPFAIPPLRVRDVAVEYGAGDGRFQLRVSPQGLALDLGRILRQLPGWSGDTGIGVGRLFFSAVGDAATLTLEGSIAGVPAWVCLRHAGSEWSTAVALHSDSAPAGIPLIATVADWLGPTDLLHLGERRDGAWLRQQPPPQHFALPELGADETGLVVKTSLRPRRTPLGLLPAPLSDLLPETIPLQSGLKVKFHYPVPGLPRDLAVLTLRSFAVGLQGELAAPTLSAAAECDVPMRLPGLAATTLRFSGGAEVNLHDSDVQMVLQFLGEVDGNGAVKQFVPPAAGQRPEPRAAFHPFGLSGITLGALALRYGKNGRAFKGWALIAQARVELEAVLNKTESALHFDAEALTVQNVLDGFLSSAAPQLPRFLGDLGFERVKLDWANTDFSYEWPDGPGGQPQTRRYQRGLKGSVRFNLFGCRVAARVDLEARRFEGSMDPVRLGGNADAGYLLVIDRSASPLAATLPPWRKAGASHAESDYEELPGPFASCDFSTTTPTLRLSARVELLRAFRIDVVAALDDAGFRFAIDQRLALGPFTYDAHLHVQLPGRAGDGTVAVGGHVVFALDLLTARAVGVELGFDLRLTRSAISGAVHGAFTIFGQSIGFDLAASLEFSSLARIGQLVEEEATGLAKKLLLFLKDVLEACKALAEAAARACAQAARAVVEFARQVAQFFADLAAVLREVGEAIDAFFGGHARRDREEAARRRLAQAQAAQALQERQRDAREEEALRKLAEAAAMDAATRAAVEQRIAAYPAFNARPESATNPFVQAPDWRSVARGHYEHRWQAAYGEALARKQMRESFKRDNAAARQRLTAVEDERAATAQRVADLSQERATAEAGLVAANGLLDSAEEACAEARRCLAAAEIALARARAEVETATITEAIVQREAAGARQDLARAQAAAAAAQAALAAARANAAQAEERAAGAREQALQAGAAVLAVESDLLAAEEELAAFDRALDELDPGRWYAARNRYGARSYGEWEEARRWDAAWHGGDAGVADLGVALIGAEPALAARLAAERVAALDARLARVGDEIAQAEAGAAACADHAQSAQARLATAMAALDAAAAARAPAQAACEAAAAALDAAEERAAASATAACEAVLQLELALAFAATPRVRARALAALEARTDALAAAFNRYIKVLRRARSTIAEPETPHLEMAREALQKYWLEFAEPCRGHPTLGRDPALAGMEADFKATLAFTPSAGAALPPPFAQPGAMPYPGMEAAIAAERARCAAGADGVRAGRGPAELGLAEARAECAPLEAAVAPAAARQQEAESARRLALDAFCAAHLRLFRHDSTCLLAEHAHAEATEQARVAALGPVAAQRRVAALRAEQARLAAARDATHGRQVLLETTCGDAPALPPPDLQPMLRAWIDVVIGDGQTHGAIADEADAWRGELAAGREDARRHAADAAGTRVGAARLALAAQQRAGLAQALAQVRTAIAALEDVVARIAATLASAQAQIDDGTQYRDGSTLSTPLQELVESSRQAAREIDELDGAVARSRNAVAALRQAMDQRAGVLAAAERGFGAALVRARQGGLRAGSLEPTARESQDLAQLALACAAAAAALAAADQARRALEDLKDAEDAAAAVQAQAPQVDKAACDTAADATDRAQRAASTLADVRSEAQALAAQAQRFAADGEAQAEALCQLRVALRGAALRCAMLAQPPWSRLAVLELRLRLLELNLLLVDAEKPVPSAAVAPPVRAAAPVRSPVAGFEARAAALVAERLQLAERLRHDAQAGRADLALGHPAYRANLEAIAAKVRDRATAGLVPHEATRRAPAPPPAAREIVTARRIPRGALPEITFEALVRAEAGARALVWGCGSMALLVDGGELIAAIDRDVALFVPQPVGECVHVAVTWKAGATASLFIEGALAAATRAPVGALRARTPLHLRRWVRLGSDPGCTVRELRIWDALRSPAALLAGRDVALEGRERNLLIALPGELAP